MIICYIYRNRKKGIFIKILIVEDEENIASLAKDWLEDEGFEIVTAYDAKTAFRLLEQSLPDAIILDVCLPDVSGLTVLKNLKSNQETSHVPVIMVSSDDDVRDTVNIGAREVLVKPIAFPILLKMLNEIKSELK
jgi:DNA-binding response OmpR family regulator